MEIQKLLPMLGFGLFFLAIDLYAFQAFKGILPASGLYRKWAVGGYWFLSFALISMSFYFRLAGQVHVNRFVLVFAFSSFFILYFSKIILCLFLAIEDVGRLLTYGYHVIRDLGQKSTSSYSPARSAALAKIAFSVAAIPFFSLIYGMVKGAHKYQVRKTRIALPNLPEAFEGLRIVQISDIHAGSFYNKEAVLKGIQLILDQKPDVVFFTGDLVNNEATEMNDYLDVFSKISAPLGVYSILGNHDYGDYKLWPNPEAKRDNLQRLKQHHAQMGWRLLLDEHVSLRREDQEIAVLGIQNWGAKGNFPKYGNLKKAHEGTEKYPVKLLLSHDPSHWDAQVIKEYPDINLMFAGHTHGMQFGVEIPGFKWSPVQYMYKQWAGLYSNGLGSQHLYVNRGFGFLGYPGRVGIWPEVSLITLEKKA
jgi:uncharacterized protein